MLCGVSQVFAYPSEGVGEPLPMEPDPGAEEDNEDSGVSPASLLLMLHDPCQPYNTAERFLLTCHSIWISMKLLLSCSM